MIFRSWKIDHGCQQYPDRYTHFQFSILQLLPKAVTPDEVIQTETLWKKKLLTYEPLGMNAN